MSFPEVGFAHVLYFHLLKMKWFGRVLCILEGTACQSRAAQVAVSSLIAGLKTVFFCK